MEPTHPFLRACLRLPVERTPVWIMRQAGRYLEEYRNTRAEAGDFLSLCKNPELACEVTLQPLRRFDLDAAILFSDILVIPEAMGMDVRFETGEGPNVGPVIQSMADVEKLSIPDPEIALKYVMDALKTIRKGLDGKVPLIGFTGSPWTLGTYMVEGGSSKTFGKIKGMLYSDPDALRALMYKTADAVAHYLNAQIENGAQAVQIFDSWGGVLAPDAFRTFSLEPMVRIIEKLNRTAPDGSKVPVILFSKGSGHLLDELADTGADVLGLDWTSDIGEARERVGHKVALQGNLDPTVLYASPDRIVREVEKVVEAFGPHPGHVFNLGHGVSPDMNPDHVKVLVDAVHDASARLLKK